MEAALGFSVIVRRLLQEECAFEAMQLRLVPAFTSGVYECQCFGEHYQPCLWLSYGSMCLSEERQTIRSQLLCSCGTPSHHTLVDLLDPFLRLPPGAPAPSRARESRPPSTAEIPGQWRG